MKVKYIHPRKGICYGNILWPGKWPMRGGKFPADHPIEPRGGECQNDFQCGQSETMRRFRERGYWASCSPEGDGIAFDCLNDQTPKQVVKDIIECFGFEVEL